VFRGTVFRGTVFRGTVFRGTVFRGTVFRGTVCSSALVLPGDRKEGPGPADRHAHRPTQNRPARRIAGGRPSGS
jgi:hypothetical protein